MLENIVWIVVAGAVMSLPASLCLSSKHAAPLWYLVLSSFASALGMGLFAIVFGVIALIARQKRESAMKTALVLTAIASVFTSYAVLALSLKA